MYHKIVSKNNIFRRRFILGRTVGIVDNFFEISSYNEAGGEWVEGSDSEEVWQELWSSEVSKFPNQGLERISDNWILSFGLILRQDLKKQTGKTKSIYIIVGVCVCVRLLGNTQRRRSCAKHSLERKGTIVPLLSSTWKKFFLIFWKFIMN